MRYSQGSCAVWDDNNKDNVCAPTIPAGLKCPPPSKTISPITWFGTELNTYNIHTEHIRSLLLVLHIHTFLKFIIFCSTVHCYILTEDGGQPKGRATRHTEDGALHGLR